MAARHHFLACPRLPEDHHRGFRRRHQLNLAEHLPKRRAASHNFPESLRLLHLFPQVVTLEFELPPERFDLLHGPSIFGSFSAQSFVDFGQFRSALANARFQFLVGPSEVFVSLAQILL